MHLTNGMPSLLDSIFGKQSLEEISLEEIQQVLAEFPSFNAAHFLLAKKMKLQNDPAYQKEAGKTALYFTNPVWLQLLLEEDRQKPEPEIRNAVNEIGEPHAFPVHEQYAEAEQEPTVNEVYAEVLESVPVVNEAFQHSLPEETTVNEEYAQETAAIPVINEVYEQEAEAGGSFSADQDRFAFDPYPAVSEQEEVPEQILTDSQALEEIEEIQEAASVTGRDYQPEIIIEEEPAVVEEEVSIVEEAAGLEEVPVYEEPALEEVPTVEQAPAVEEASTFEQGPAFEEASSFEEAPAVEEASTFDPDPAVEQTAAYEQSPAEAVFTAESDGFRQTGDGHSAGSPEAEENPGQPAAVFDSKKAESIVFAPYHMVDYFASQGIKLVLEEHPQDNFGKQLKSFTDWLKVMKKIPAQTMEGRTDEREAERIRHFAANSIEERDILTETMAEVLAKQGMYENAIALYQKLSLIYPPKSAYFASRIEQLKASLS